MLTLYCYLMCREKDFFWEIGYELIWQLERNHDATVETIFQTERGPNQIKQQKNLPIQSVKLGKFQKN